MIHASPSSDGQSLQHNIRGEGFAFPSSAKGHCKLGSATNGLSFEEGQIALRGFHFFQVYLPVFSFIVGIINPAFFDDYFGWMLRFIMAQRKSPNVKVLIRAILMQIF